MGMMGLVGGVTAHSRKLGQAQHLPSASVRLFCRIPPAAPAGAGGIHHAAPAGSWR
jgi:hypothetical protein